MITDKLSFDWTSGESIDFEVTFRDIYCILEENIMCPDDKSADRLFVYSSGLISLVLELKIEGELAQEALLDSIILVSGIYAEEPSISLLNRIRELTSNYQSMIYANKYDKYSWYATDPKLVKTLAEDIDFQPSLIIGAAFGSIRPGLILASYFNCDIYFLRFSNFKRHDSKPIIDSSDISFLQVYCNMPVLILDEDVATGNTLKQMKDSLSPYLKNMYTGSVIRHYLSSYKPNFVGKTWYDEI